MSTVLYDKNGLYLARFWDSDEESACIEIRSLHQIFLLSQQQLRELLPNLTGFAQSEFSGPEDV